MSTSPSCATGMYLAAAVDGVPAHPCAHRVPTLPAPHTHPLPARALARALADFALCPEFSSLVGSLDPPVSAESGPEYYEEPPGAGDGGEKQISWTPEVEFLGPASEICWAFFVWLVLFLNRRAIKSMETSTLREQPPSETRLL